MRVGLIACAKQKGDAAAPAQELYTSQLFRAARAYAEREYDRWYILSAKHGLVEPTRVIEPYDVTLLDKSDHDLAAWGCLVRQQLMDARLIAADLFLHAGNVYRNALALDEWWRVQVPLAGLTIGWQKHWYAVQASKWRAAREAQVLTR